MPDDERPDRSPLSEAERLARRRHGSDLRGAAALLLEATKGVMGVVEDTHRAIGAFPVVTDLAYGAVRGVTGIVESCVDAAVTALAPLLGEGVPGREREAVLAALNGVVGDYLEQTKNPLAIQMSLRPPLVPEQRGGELLVLVHGCAMNDLQWTRAGHDHGRALADDLGLTTAYVHYNSGRHVFENGEELAALLERESERFATISLIGHSMGGLVARAAIHTAEEAGYAWRKKLRVLVTLGTPHHGAPAERLGNLADHLLGSTRYSAPLRALGQIRSAGVTDLRYGNVTAADCRARDRFERGPDPRAPTTLPAGVRCYAVAATKGPSAPSRGGSAGDGIVPTDSALGRHPEDAFTLRFDDARVVTGTKHLDLLASHEVYALLRGWLASS